MGDSSPQKTKKSPLDGKKIPTLSEKQYLFRASKKTIIEQWVSYHSPKIILEFSKLRSGEFTIEPKVFSLHEELSHSMELFVANANAKDITIISFINPNISKELFGDILRIKQILSNFLSNAIKFTPEGGMIRVEAQCDMRMLKISVTDSGVGISSDVLEHVFEAFAQAPEHSEFNKNGTGLGLSISQQLAKLMGGRVSVKSAICNKLE